MSNQTSDSEIKPNLEQVVDTLIVNHNAYFKGWLTAQLSEYANTEKLSNNSEQPKAIKIPA